MGFSLDSLNPFSGGGGGFDPLGLFKGSSGGGGGLGGMLAGFLAAQTPPPPPPPQAPPTLKIAKEAGVDASNNPSVKAAAMMGGTLLTGPQGLTSPALTGKKTLLGG